MELSEPNKSIEEEKDLLTFLEKYINSGSPATTNCSRGRRRSISDLHDLYMNYNPESKVSYEDIIICLPLMKITLTGYYDKNPRYISMRYCPDVEKVVVFAGEEGFSGWEFFSKYNMNILYDRTGSSYDKGIDGMSLKLIFQILKENY